MSQSVRRVEVSEALLTSLDEDFKLVPEDEIEVLEFSDDAGLLDRCHAEPPEVHDPMWNDPDEVVDA